MIIRFKLNENLDSKDLETIKFYREHPNVKENPTLFMDFFNKHKVTPLLSVPKREGLLLSLAAQNFGTPWNLWSPQPDGSYIKYMTGEDGKTKQRIFPTPPFAELVTTPEVIDKAYNVLFGKINK